MDILLLYYPKKRGNNMNDFVIETKKLIKVYGEQTAVKSVDLHVKPGRIYGCWAEMEPVKQRL